MKYIAFLFFPFGIFAAQETATISKISKIQLGSNDPKTVYFQLEQMPNHISQWFYVRASAGDDHTYDL